VGPTVSVRGLSCTWLLYTQLPARYATARCATGCAHQQHPARLPIVISQEWVRYHADHFLVAVTFRIGRLGAAAVIGAHGYAVIRIAVAPTFTGTELRLLMVTFASS
jgi:hypothetical protein